MIVRVVITALVFTLMAIYLPDILIEDETSVPVSEKMRERITELHEQGSLSIETTTVKAYADLIPKFYQHLGYQLAWSNPAQVETLLQNIASIEEDGLNKEDYHHAELIALIQKPAETADDAQLNKVNLEILLTDALLRLVYNLKYGKVVPHELDENWNFSRKFSGDDPVARLQEIIDNEDELSRILEENRNRGPFYKFLKQALVKYRGIQQQGGWQTIPAGPAIKQGMQDQRLPLIYARLLATRDIAPIDQENITIYSAALQRGVKQFQERHNLDNDGIIGKKTLAAMNVKVAQRIDQIRANLERPRWLTQQEKKSDFVLVNIAGYQVYLVKDSKIAWSSKAQVGKNYRQTPVFRDEIEYLVINPTWTVPPTILKKDILPAIKKDFNYLKLKNMNVIDRKGKVVNPKTIKWNTVNGDNFPYMIRQEPGPNNALGRVKIMFPNKHAVYLHDTAYQNKFGQKQRAFSSGCIRVQKPFELAEILLDDKDKWNRQAFDEILETGETTTIRLTKKMPVYLMYATVDLNINKQGIVYFEQDIYGRDAKIIAELKRPFRYVPLNNTPKDFQRDI